MTKEDRKEAIEQLENAKALIKHDGKDYLDERDIPILNMAIEALKKEPCEHCVNVHEVLNTLRTFGKPVLKFDYILAVEQEIKDLPLVYPVRTKGKWKEYKAYSFDGEHPSYDITRCSNCNYEALTNTWKYCPNCGAEMENEE